MRAPLSRFAFHLASLAVLVCVPAEGAVLRVKAGANGAQNGSSWPNAFSSLQDALAAAQPGDEVWVSQGTYRPDQGGGQTLLDRNATFLLPDDVAVYGGFLGNELFFFQRAGLYLETVLTGDLAGDDATGSLADNSRHVVTVADGTGSGCLLDGLVVEGGYADGVSQFDPGGADLLVGGDPRFVNVHFQRGTATGQGGLVFVESFAAPTFSQCVFEDGHAFEGGAVVAWFQSPATFDECVFRDNEATERGGALLARAHCHLVVHGCLFANNKAGTLGGGMAAHHHSAPRVRNSIFLHNTAGQDGGGFHHYDNSDPRLANCVFLGNHAGRDGGGVFSSAISENRLVLANSVFSGNTAEGNGGGLYGENFLTGSAIEVRNCTFSTNLAQGETGGIYYEKGSSPQAMTIANSILWGNVDQFVGATDEEAQVQGPVVVHYTTVQGWTGKLGGVGNIKSDPLFANPFGQDGKVGTLDDNLKLLAPSKAIDSGDNGAAAQDDLDLDNDGNLTEPVPLDLALAVRFADALAPDAGLGAAPIIDRGAFETPADQVCQQSLGFAGPGTIQFSICGEALTAKGNTATLRVLNAAPNAPLFLFASPSIKPVPLEGGTLVPSINPAVLYLATNGAGQLIVNAIPGGDGKPVTVYAQVIVPKGFVAEFSNALAVEIGL